MLRICLTLLFLAGIFCFQAQAAPTVFFKDGTKEVGNSVWIDGNRVYLSKSSTIYEFSSDEVKLEETQRFNHIGASVAPSLPDRGTRNVAEPKSGKQLEQLMGVIGIDRQVDQFVQQFSSGAMSFNGANSELAEVMNQALSEIDPQGIKRQIRRYYSSHLDSATIEAMLTWGRSPLGQKITNAQVNAQVSSPDMARQIMRDQEENPPPADRLALIRELDKAGKATEMAQQIIMEAINGSLSAIPATNAESKKARKEFSKQMNQRKTALTTELRKQVQAGLIHTYKELKDGELRDFIGFLRTESARKFTKVTMGAMGEMTRTISAAMVKQIVNSAKKMSE